MSPSSGKLKGLAGVLVGHLLYGASQHLGGGSVDAGILPLALGIAAGAMMVVGGGLYVQSKGYAAPWGVFAFVPFIGIGTLLLIPPMSSLSDELDELDELEDTTPKPTEALPAEDEGEVSEGESAEIS